MGRARAAVKDGFASTWLLPTAELGVGLQAGPQLWLGSWASPAGEVGQGDEDDTKLGGVVDTPEGDAAVWRDLDKLEKWAHSNLVKFNPGKCKVLPLRRNNPRHQDRLGLSIWKAAW
ncbi:mitochondrial enolase superfamily member 1 [Grus japonensis]|uniref:Mitochondrial enolase superfamily member 1 n=1 Tax=Grus japonensis TaxID=30415 RepID=A0ABC9WL47_GRUJA